MAEEKGPDMENRDPNDLNAHVKVRLLHIWHFVPACDAFWFQKRFHSNHRCVGIVHLE